MEKYCKNCGEKLDENSQFCPKCGTKTANKNNNVCPSCGESIENSENFCENCGTKLNAPKVVKTEGFIEKHKLALMIILFIIIIVTAIPVSMFIVDEGAGSQVVTVDAYDFKIPDNFNKSESGKLVSSTDERGVSKHWVHDSEYIEIWVLPPKYADDSANYIVSSVGGAKQNKYGITGYHNKFNDGGEAFSFVKDNKAITIFVSNERLFDKIEVL